MQRTKQITMKEVPKDNVKTSESYNELINFAVRYLAIRDITEHIIKLRKINNCYNKKESYIVTPKMIFGKESCRLNAELGVHKINKFGDKNIKGKNKKKNGLAR